MTDTPPHDADQSAEKAHGLAEHAAEDLDSARPDIEAASAEDVAEQTEVPVHGNPSEKSSLESDVTGPGAPMP